MGVLALLIFLISDLRVAERRLGRGLRREPALLRGRGDPRRAASTLELVGALALAGHRGRARDPDPAAAGSRCGRGGARAEDGGRTGEPRRRERADERAKRRRATGHGSAEERAAPTRPIRPRTQRELGPGRSSVGAAAAAATSGSGRRPCWPAPCGRCRPCASRRRPAGRSSPGSRGRGARTSTSRGGCGRS